MLGYLVAPCEVICSRLKAQLRLSTPQAEVIYSRQSATKLELARVLASVK
ncbi:MAG: hypothetical protein H6R01_914 [Burkholderiaceae bacterium]|nr:hypothetical protein [Burkholderiaceae bacterium]